MRHVEILVGSPSDLPFLWESDLLDRLEEAGISYAVSACSAHRNTNELAERIDQTILKTSVYVCAAGWAAALPGAVKALLLRRSLATVFGIALPSEHYPDGDDAEISILRLPPGIDVVYVGVGTDGFNAMSTLVVQQARAYDPLNPDLEMLEKVKAKIKQPQFDIPRPKEG